MSFPQQIAALAVDRETNIRAAEFLQVCRALVVSRSEREAQAFLARVPASDRAREAFTQRASVNPGTVSDSTWGGALSTYSQLSEGFASTVNSAFDKILNDGSFLRVPPMTRVAVASAGMVAFTVGEGAPKGATQGTLTAVELTMAKVTAFLTVATELLRAGGAGALNLLGEELRRAVAKYTDQYFIAQLVTGLTAIPTAGSSALAIRNDIRFLLDAVSFDSDARLYFIAPPQIAKRLSSVGDAQGGRMFPQLTPTNGFLDGVPLVTSDQATAGTLTLVDARQVAVSAAEIVLDRSDAATLVMDSAPSSPPVAGDNYFSTWQANASALRAERFLSVQRMRTTAVAQVSGVTGVGNSPS
jgi:hypothetical protein